MSSAMLRLVRLAEPTVRKRSSTIISFEWMYVARSGVSSASQAGSVKYMPSRWPVSLATSADASDDLRLRQPDRGLLLQRLAAHVEDHHDLERERAAVAHARLQRLGDARAS